MKKVTVQLVDDLDGAVIDEGSGRTVTFGLDGQVYEIDLSLENERQLRAALEAYVKAARTVGKPRKGPGRFAGPTEVQTIRDWARANGIEVSDRGRVSASVREAFAASR